MSRIYVVGHRNPDLDSIASAIAYAWKLSHEFTEEVVPARAGPVNAQTAWVLDRLGLDAPMLLSDVAPRFGDAARRLDVLTPDRPLKDAWEIIERSGPVAPVVDDNQAPVGLISGASFFSLLRERTAHHPDGPEMRLSEILETPCGEAVDAQVPSFSERTPIRDGIKRVLREERDDFWVVDEQGRYVGVCRKPDLLQPKRAKLMLVDHNGSAQSVGSLDEAVLLGVLDHHRLENPPTHLPIRFHVEPVGSTCTLVCERMDRGGAEPPPAIAALLLAGIFSDTLMLRSPTTTERDRQAVHSLEAHAFLPESPLAGQTVDSFGMELLRAGTGLDTRDPWDVVTGDLKTYESAGLRFGIAQVEVADEPDISERLPSLREALERLNNERNFDFSALMVTEVVGGFSRIVIAGAPPSLDELPYPRLPDGSLDARGVVSRKKQLLPATLALLER